MAQYGGYSNESPTFYMKESLAFCIKHVNENGLDQAEKKFVCMFLYIDEDDQCMLLLFSDCISDSKHAIKTCLEISVFLQLLLLGMYMRLKSIKTYLILLWKDLDELWYFATSVWFETICLILWYLTFN